VSGMQSHEPVALHVSGSVQPPQLFELAQAFVFRPQSLLAPVRHVTWSQTHWSLVHVSSTLHVGQSKKRPQALVRRPQGRAPAHAATVTSSQPQTFGVGVGPPPQV
jgi:hypothetical protein